VLVVLLELLLLGLHPLLHRERYHGASPDTVAIVAADLADGHCPICRVARHGTLLSPDPGA